LYFVNVRYVWWEYNRLEILNHWKQIVGILVSPKADDFTPTGLSKNVHQVHIKMNVGYNLIINLKKKCDQA